MRHEFRTVGNAKLLSHGPLIEPILQLLTSSEESQQSQSREKSGGETHCSNSSSPALRSAIRPLLTDISRQAKSRKPGFQFPHPTLTQEIRGAGPGFQKTRQWLQILINFRVDSTRILRG